ncbi:MAG TPA: glutamate racemase, partial [Gammaproteobacteria bacterium]|nr:glutamate racemase [Gammaproteobacteria bacterium]
MKTASTLQSLPIGIFDSGVGGLTVLRELRAQLPHENLLYLGDTARVPYGVKSVDSVVRYAQQAADYMVVQDIKALVIACNTASAVALDALRLRYAHLPLQGVIEPGAQAAGEISPAGRIAVLATEGAVNGGAYQRAITACRPDAIVTAQAASLLVALAEEGWLQGKLVEDIIAQYIEPLLRGSETTRPDTLVLGCTHFPVLADAIHAVVGDDVLVVDSAATTAAVVKQQLTEQHLLVAPGQPGDTHFQVTDNP